VGTGYRQHPGNVSKPKQAETPAKTSTGARSEDGITTGMIRPPKEPRDTRGPGTYKEVLTDIRIATFWET
jgi:hypothetical protein